MAGAYGNEAVLGLKAAQAAFKALPDVARERLGDAAEDTAIRVLAGARRRVASHRRYGFLERYLDRSMNRTTGEARVGLPRRAAVIPGGAAPGSARTGVIRRRGAATFDVYGSGSAQGARVVYPSKYAHLVEFGHGRGAGKSSAPAYPFMIPAAEAEKQSFLRACQEAGQKIERDLSVSRFL
jgi:hypothetical protein